LNATICMQLTDFQFDLPEELIAQVPLAERSASRLLVQTGTKLAHHQFSELPTLLKKGDLLVFNNTRVIPARLYGQKPTGGKLELLIERVTGIDEVLTKIRASKAMKTGAEFEIASVKAEVLGRQDDLFSVRFNLPNGVELSAFIEEHGQIPLPPYIQRAPDDSDLQRYQTVYAKEPGAVAAPTAGLHFDESVLEALAANGINHTFITLHVGAGTFMPVRVDDIASHVMHAERAEVSQSTVDAIEATKRAGGRVIAVGTTSVRALESAASTGTLQACKQETRLFLTPGCSFNVIDAMITNFHLPESTLLMLVSAFGGMENTLAAYTEAVQNQYRFFSYGDAMLVWPAS